jgi:hypothetical protein
MSCTLWREVKLGRTATLNIPYDNNTMYLLPGYYSMVLPRSVVGRYQGWFVVPWKGADKTRPWRLFVYLLLA